jgi:protein AbiQ
MEGEMEVNYEDFGFYKVDINYIKYLHSVDSQVFYKNVSNYQRKPHLGLITKLGGHTYCIPLTSAKKRHINWSNITEHNYIIYENVKFEEIHSNDVYKKIGQTDTYKKLLSILEIRKMIPVDDELCEFIDFSLETDPSYKDLLEKEYFFLKTYRDEILKKAEVLYEKQKATGEVKSCYCNFKLLEEAYNKYKCKK